MKEISLILLTIAVMIGALTNIAQSRDINYLEYRIEQLESFKK